jgi:hypothetical protein
VIAVGGTSLTRDASARGWTESAWGNGTGGAGSGCSAYEPKPSWQHDTGCPNRTEADVSAVADPATYVAIYVNGGWEGAAGTSAASPIIAAVYALAGRPAAGTYPASYLYGDTADLNDVISGNNDVTYHSCTVAYLCNGVAGYDGPTGLGTPNGTGAFTATTVPTAPGKPTNLVAVAGNATVGLTWTAPDNGGSAITGYTMTETEAGLGHVTCPMTGATSCTVSGLTNGTEYTFTVTAANAVGAGPASDPSNKVNPVNPVTAPDAPTGVTATGGLGSASVSWTAPAANGGSPITLYTVTSAPDGKTCTTSDALSCTVSGLTSGTTYTFTVTAANAVGAGPASDPSAGVLVFTGATFHAVTPGRVLDSRISLGAGTFHSRTKQSFAVTGLFGVPAGAVAVTGNVTIVGQTRLGYVTVAPSLTSGVQPPTSTINFPLGDTRANGITVPLGAGGKLDAMYWSASTSNTIGIIFDVTGYFS